ncbi:uncharacterized protein M6B38_270950 [Iris pallida]|uniref:Uncharacterized protein n=1 Tax=Iris pallida TaxID=29817 RepID=A0AAX6I836_IRIPA|nr:uncharacterized protein M6B38_270950 [Iris pallida]
MVLGAIQGSPLSHFVYFVGSQRKIIFVTTNCLLFCLNKIHTVIILSSECTEKLT